MTEPSPSASTANLPTSPPCPFCEGEETELVSTFGAHASVSTYWCRRCRSPFELLKWRRSGPSTETGPPGAPEKAEEGEAVEDGEPGGEVP